MQTFSDILQSSSSAKKQNPHLPDSSPYPFLPAASLPWQRAQGFPQESHHHRYKECQLEIQECQVEQCKSHFARWIIKIMARQCFDIWYLLLTGSTKFHVWYAEGFECHCSQNVLGKTLARLSLYIVVDANPIAPLTFRTSWLTFTRRTFGTTRKRWTSLRRLAHPRRPK